MENTEQIMVSICCIAYNQEKYIRKMLDSLLMQKTDFAYEIIIHDDASTDNTANIIREYEEKYPEIIKAMYQVENQYSKGVSVSFNYNYPRCRGKYIAWCEGDDYWSEPLKLQKQVEVLEKNCNCAVCVHKVQMVSEDEQSVLESFPRYEQLKEGIINSKEFLSLVVYTRTMAFLQFHITSFMARREYIMKYSEEIPEFRKIFDVGDIPMLLYLGTCGDAYYIEEYMSCYRGNAVGSWNTRENALSDRRIKHLNTECRALQEFDKYSNYIVHESVEKGINARKFEILRLNHNIKEMKSAKMIEFYRMLPLRMKIREHLIKFCPVLMKTYRKLVKNK